MGCCGLYSGSVHPHIRGAYQFGRFHNTRKLGSSPHTWGIPLDYLAVVQSNRFIPTYVGHTGGGGGGAGGMSGSSPHTWGIPPDMFVYREPVRFIPTYVGHTRHEYVSRCGDYGSSPHTWGIQNETAGGCCGSRFIPTYVGHTPFHSIRPRRPPVHPHIRGAYPKRSLLPISLSGSSPHTWGIHKEIALFMFIHPVHPHIRGAYTGPP